MIISKTPYRISFFGGGTDYPEWYKINSGQVLATSIDKYSYITCRYLPPFFNHRISISYGVMEKCMQTKEVKHPSAKAVLNYLKILDNVAIHHDGDLPARSGIGSSSTFTVGLYNALSKYLNNYNNTKRKLSETSIFIEQNIVGECVGSQDQICAAYGGFNHIVFKKNGNFTVNKLSKISSYTKKRLEKKLMLFHTGIFRIAENLTKKYVNNLNNKSKYLKEIHSMVDVAIDILENGNIDDFGKLLNETWHMKKKINNQISNNSINSIYSIAMANGAIGGKLLGAGGGGFMLFYVPERYQSNIIKKLSKLVYIPFNFEDDGSQLIYTSKHQDYKAQEKFRMNNKLKNFKELKIK